MIQAISTVGFPIVCCGVMFYQLWQINKMHKEESNRWSDALMNNTLAIQSLTDLIERGKV